MPTILGNPMHLLGITHNNLLDCPVQVECFTCEIGERVLLKGKRGHFLFKPFQLCQAKAFLTTGSNRCWEQPF